MQFVVWIDEDALNAVGGLHGEKTTNNGVTIDEMKEEIMTAMDDAGLEGFCTVEWMPPAE